jgi:transposase
VQLVGYVRAAYSSVECPACEVSPGQSRVSRGLGVCTARGHAAHAELKAAVTSLNAPRRADPRPLERRRQPHAATDACVGDETDLGRLRALGHPALGGRNQGR